MTVKETLLLIIFKFINFKMGCTNAGAKGNFKIVEIKMTRSISLERERRIIEDQKYESRIKEEEEKKKQNDLKKNNDNNNQEINTNLINNINEENKEKINNNNLNKEEKKGILKSKKKINYNNEENSKNIEEEKKKKSNRRISFQSNSSIIKDKSKQKKRNKSCEETLKNNKNKIKNEEISSDENEIKKEKNIKKQIDNNLLIKKDSLWNEAKKNLFIKFKESIEESEVYNKIDLSITSIISISKNDFTKFTLSQKFLIHQIKNENDINWMRKPFNSLKKNLAKISTLNPLLENYINFDFNNFSLNEYEPFYSEIKMLKLNIKEKKQQLEHYTYSSEKINENVIILIFNFDDSDSIILFKEILNYKKKNNLNQKDKNKFLFFPVYGQILESAMTTSYIWNTALNYDFNEEDLEIYFLENNDLNKRFNYISNDNEKKIICKIILIDENKIIRHILYPKDFTFNLLSQINKINKKDYEKFKNNLNIFISEHNNSLNKLLKNPLKCNLFLKKTKVYSYDKTDKKIIPFKTYYETLTGELNNKENINNIFEELEGKFKYEKRENPKKFKINHSKKINIISNFIGDLLEKNKLYNITYITKFEINKLNMRINPNNNYEQMFDIIKNKNFKIEIFLPYYLFHKKHHYSISLEALQIIQFPFAKTLDYISCILNLNEIFPKDLKLYDSKTKDKITFNVNEKENDNINLIIIFSLSSKDYFAKMEMIYRLNQIYKKIENLKNSINIYLIYRGELYNFDKEFNEIKDEDIFNENFPLYISSSDNIFPLYFQNNGIESSDSQLKVFILDNNNKLLYQGICDEINLKVSLLNILNNKEIKYLKHYPIDNEVLKDQIQPIINNIEKLIEKILTKNPNEKLLYRPYVSFSCCKYNSYKNSKCKNICFINNLRIKILIKEKHKNIVLKNQEIKENLKQLKEYGTSILIVPLPCEELNINFKCNICKSKIDKNKSFYYNQEEESLYCLDCEKKKENNSVNLIYFKTETFDNEIISELFSSNINYNSEIDPSLGLTCKICNNQNIGNEFYLNLTHINNLSQISPLLSIDICQSCFNVIENGSNFTNNISKDNYNKLGLSSEHMIYRRIKFQSHNDNIMFKFSPFEFGDQ